MKILCLGDSPTVRTGFGVVNRVAVDTLLELGHEIVVLGGQDTKQRDTGNPRYTYIPVESETADMLGWSMAPKVIEEHKPDAVSIVGDPAMVTVWVLHKSVADLPILAYMPVEGSPLNYQWIKAFKETPNLSLVTTSKYGHKVLEDAGIEAQWAYHGVSDDFKPISAMRREAWRRALGWEDKFVVINVAQNVRRKQWPRLFEAIAILKKRYPNLLLYAHTVPFNNYWLGGHDLSQLAEQMGIWDRVVFPPSHLEHNAAVPLHGGENPGLVDMYGIADMFVLPSQVEGFGLPLVEAMRMGLPVAHTDYGAGAEVIGRAGIHLPVHDWEWNQSHSIYANVNPRDIANAIDRVAKSEELRNRYSKLSLERAPMFTWDAYKGILKEKFGAAERQTETSPEVNRLDEAVDGVAQEEVFPQGEIETVDARD